MRTTRIARRHRCAPRSAQQQTPTPRIPVTELSEYDPAAICDDGGVKRLVFLDVDGTLLNDNQELPDSARHALTQAIAAGHRLILCTGRSRPEIYPFLWEIGFCALVGCNGAYGEVDGETVFDDHMPSEDVTEIAAWLEAAGADSLWQTATDLHAVGKFLDLFRQSEESEPSISGNWSEFLEAIAPHLREGVPDTAAKVTFFLPRESGTTLADARATFGERFTIVDGSLPHQRGETGELTALGMNKSVGMAKIAAHFGTGIADTIAVGDSANDVEMLRAAGIGVAMGNGIPEVKAAADWVTKPIDDDGLALAFERLGLLGE